MDNLKYKRQTNFEKIVEKTRTKLKKEIAKSIEPHISIDIDDIILPKLVISGKVITRMATPRLIHNSDRKFMDVCLFYYSDSLNRETYFELSEIDSINTLLKIGNKINSVIL